MKNRGAILIKTLFLVYISLVCFFCFFNFSSVEIELAESFLGIPIDKWFHFIMFFPYPFITWLTCIYSRHFKRFHKYSISFTFITGLILAVATELAQACFFPARQGDFLDFVADGIAILSGTIIIALIQKREIPIMKFISKITGTSMVLLLSILFSLELSAQSKQEISSDSFQAIADSVSTYVSPLADMKASVTIDTVYVLPKRKLEIHFARSLGEYPLRNEQVENIYNIAKLLIPNIFSRYDIKIFSGRTLLEDLSSPYFSGKTKSYVKAEYKDNPWVKNTSLLYSSSRGLENKHIALWQSHGYYYEQKASRWEWQRARLLQTVEDIYTQSYVVPFLTPMLENAGAYVALPRERDVQKNEVIIDNIGKYYSERNGSSKEEWTNIEEAGFANPKKAYEHGENPFKMGNASSIPVVRGNSSSNNTSHATWNPDFPEAGEYAVYISYITLPSSSTAAEYLVRHSGGNTSFIVNQTMGGGTWVYLGTFLFNEGEFGQGVTLYNSTPEGSKYKRNTLVVADAARFGGGLGNIARNPSNSDFEVHPETSGYPRYLEGARYWLQWAGFDEAVYSNNKCLDDYKDDYQSRGLWVNALSGGSTSNPNTPGSNVPIDLSLGFHTDAGSTPTDSTIGTLVIYSQFAKDGNILPTGEPRLISRELADIVQTQIVNDIRSTYEPNWTRRGLWDRAYSESWTPVVPAMILELLSHQNFADMKYGLDPSFRFMASRSIYKGILKFISIRDNRSYVVQPLPVKEFSTKIVNLKNKPYVELSWAPRVDHLEPTAAPDDYIVYTREEDGFDNGILISDETSCILPIEPGKTYSYKIVAVNEGGASFPSEILSVGLVEDSWRKAKTAIIVNGFDRVSAPASFSTKDSTRAGFLNAVDAGVGYIRDYSFSGIQQEYQRKKSWTADDAPGFGTSSANYETQIIAGNTFDYTLLHGTAMLKGGYNFVSSSRDAVVAHKVYLSEYPVMDIIMGKQLEREEKHSSIPIPSHEVFSVNLQKVIKNYCENGGNIIVSGAYIASDIWHNINKKAIKHSHRKDVQAIQNKIGSLSEDLDDLMVRLYRKSSNTRRLNDSIGFNYLHNDTISLISIQAAINDAKYHIECLNEIATSSSKDISKIEKEADPDEKSKEFVKKILKYKWITGSASKTGITKAIQNPIGFWKNDGNIPNSQYTFFTTPNQHSYSVESPDAIAPADKNAWTILRYSENNTSAAIAYNGQNYKSVSLGFPIESLKSQDQINSLIAEILRFFAN